MNFILIFRKEASFKSGKRGQSSEKKITLFFLKKFFFGVNEPF